MTGPQNEFMTTFTGRTINVLHPDPEDFDYIDIATGLGNQARFCGQTKIMLTVAQHSIIVMRLCDPEYHLEALLHDATEAYMCDVARPFKQFCPGYRNIETIWDSAIRMKFGLPPEMSDAVKYADDMAQAIEAREMRIYKWDEWGLPDPKDQHKIKDIWRPGVARMRFIRAIEELVME